MLETVAIIFGLVHTISMLVLVPVWQVLSKLNKSIAGVKDALQDLRLHISEKYATKDDFYRLERQYEEAVQRVNTRIDAFSEKL